MTNLTILNMSNIAWSSKPLRIDAPPIDLCNVFYTEPLQTALSIIITFIIIIIFARLLGKNTTYEKAIIDFCILIIYFVVIVSYLILNPKAYLQIITLLLLSIPLFYFTFENFQHIGKS